MITAITRAVSPAIARGERTHIDRQPIDYELAVVQHQQYENILRGLGCRVVTLEASPDFPDCVFIEDTAVVFDDIALVTRPGAPSRRGEVGPVAACLIHYRPLAFIEEPATIDGGDVLVIRKTVFIGRTSRTNDEAIAQARNILGEFGYEVRGIPVDGALHLKTAVTALDERTVIINPQWVDRRYFEDFEQIETEAAEPFGANVARVGDTILLAAENIRTAELLRQRGVKVQPIAASEIMKAEGGVTCCSLLMKT